jgi:hypothetical protein
VNARRVLPLFTGLLMASTSLAQPAPGGHPGGPEGDRPPLPRMRDDHDRRDGPGRDGPGRDGPGRRRAATCPF